MTVKLLKQSILGQRCDPLMVFLDDTEYYYTRHWNISSTMFVMLLRFVLCLLLWFRKNTQLATVGTHHREEERCPLSSWSFSLARRSASSLCCCLFFLLLPGLGSPGLGGRDVPGRNKPEPNSLSIMTQDYWFQISGWFHTDNQRCVVTIMGYQGSRSQLFCYDSHPLAMV